MLDIVIITIFFLCLGVTVFLAVKQLERESRRSEMMANDILTQILNHPDYRDMQSTVHYRDGKPVVVYFKKEIEK